MERSIKFYTRFLKGWSFAKDGVIPEGAVEGLELSTERGFGWSAKRGVISGGAVTVPSWFLNAKASQFSNSWLPALAAQKAGVRNAKIAFVGDSTTAGQDAVISPQTERRRKSVAAQLASLFRADGRASMAESSFAKNGLTDPNDLSDARFVTTGTLGSSGLGIPGGGLHVLDSIDDKLSFTPDFPVDTFDIYYVSPGSGTNTFTADVDGGAPLGTFNPGGASLAIRKSTVTTTLGLHKLNINWLAGSVRIAGIEGYNSAQKQISCWNFGISGAYTGQWADVSQPSSRLRGVVEGYVPDLVVISLGINDWRFSRTLSEYENNLNAFITRCNNAGIDVMGETPFWDNSSTGLAAQQADYIQKARDVFISLDKAIVDTAARWVSFSASSALGRYSDAVHNSQAGHLERATAMKQAVTLFEPE